MKHSQGILQIIDRWLHFLCNPADHPRVRRLWYTLMVGTLLTTVVYIYFRADIRAAPELLTKIIYAGPIPAIVIVWIYSRLRWRNWQLTPLTLIPDSVVFALALARFLGHFPFSGHALFLSYLVLTAGRSRLTLACSLIILIETILLKLIVFQDSHSLPLGILLMIPIALLYNSFDRRRENRERGGPA